MTVQEVDMNDVLVKYGEDRVNEIIADAHPYPIDGVVEGEFITMLVMPVMLNS